LGLAGLALLPLFPLPPLLFPLPLGEAWGRSSSR
jgi:hypothetical protein